VEFDLKQFFEKVRIKAVAARLRSLKMPEEFVKWIIDLNLSAPILPEERKIDERLAETKEYSRKAGYNPVEPGTIDSQTRPANCWQG